MQQHCKLVEIFSVTPNSIRWQIEITGYAKDHPGHKDHNESLYANYASMLQLFDDLYAAKSSLFIDCTFETMGGLQLIDYAMLKHAGQCMGDAH